MTLYSEASYFDGAHFQHIADRDEHLRLKRQRAEVAAMSMGDLHHRLGRLVEDGPGYRVSTDGSARRIDTNRRHFEEIEIVRGVDLSTLDRLSQFAADHLASLSPERRAELQAEWEQ